MYGLALHIWLLVIDGRQNHMKTMSFVCYLDEKMCLFFILLNFIQFSIKTLMKKLKRQRSLTSKPKQTKQIVQCKTPLTSKKNLLNKKQKSHQKENKSFAPQGLFITRSSKNNNVKSKQRSKSLLFDKKGAEPLTIQTHRNAPLDHFHKKCDKEDTDISAHLNSIKYDKHLFHNENFYSNYVLSAQEFPDLHPEPKQNEELAKIKQLQQQNQAFRVNISAIKEEMKNFVLENQCIKQENTGLKHRISSFELETSALMCEMKAKEIQLVANHKKQRKYLESKINKLQNDQEKLIKQKNAAEETAKTQYQDIIQLQKDKNQLQVQCEQERGEKETLKKEKQEAIKRIIGLEQQVHHFQDNLKGFDKLKQTYESRLSQLEAQKQKIKKNACQLLQIVQNYRQL